MINRNKINHFMLTRVIIFYLIKSIEEIIKVSKKYGNLPNKFFEIKSNMVSY